MGQWRGRRRRCRTACEQSAGMEAPYCGEISKFGHETSSSDVYACKNIVKLSERSHKAHMLQCTDFNTSR